MIAFNYSSRLRKDLAIWVDKGILTQDQADAAGGEFQARSRGPSFATVLAFLGAILLVAALLSFVAANWDTVPRLVRTFMLIASIWLAYSIAWFAHSKNAPGISAAFIVLGIGAFGASIMLIGQMFHLQGSTATALMVWFLGAVLTALVTQSVAALCMASLVAFGWMIAEYPGSADQQSLFGIPVFYVLPATVAALGLIAHWLASRVAGHFILLLAVAWSLMLISVDAQFAGLVIALGLLCVSICLASLTSGQYFRGFERVMIFYAMALIMSAFQLVQIFLNESFFSNRQVAGEAIPIMALVVTIIVTAILAFRAKGSETSLYRDQWVVPVFAMACLIWLAFPMLAAPKSDGAELVQKLVYGIVGLFLAIWSVRFGWRLEMRSLSVIGYIFFAIVIFYTYVDLFGSLEMTAVVYGIGGLLLIGAAVWLLRRERRAQT
ncbi:MAG: DUF2157 domain-containing protein [Pseudomonadota bacterium]